MAVSDDDESSSFSHVSETCFICNEEFTTDLQLTNHLIEHSNEEGFKTKLAEKEKSNPSTPNHTAHSRTVLVGRRQLIPEFTKTSFVREPPVRKKPVVNTASAEPEVWEVVSDSDEETNSNPKKQKLSNSFRLVNPGATQATGNPSSKEAGPPFQCHSCSSVFNNVTAFKMHLLTHDKSHPYVCHICKKSFAYKGTLRQHLHLHISEKSHECKVCKKKFTIKSLLRKHEETHMQQFQEQGST